jgi:hypothetical protein
MPGWPLVAVRHLLSPHTWCSGLPPSTDLQLLVLNRLLLPPPCPRRSDQYVPKRVEAVGHVALVAGGWRHTLAADREGRVYACGWNKFGQCGVGSTEDVVTPQQVQGLDGERVVQLKSGWKHTLAVTDSGKLYSWGRNVNGQVRGGLQAGVCWPGACCCCCLHLRPPLCTLRQLLLSHLVLCACLQTAR